MTGLLDLLEAMGGASGNMSGLPGGVPAAPGGGMSGPMPAGMPPLGGGLPSNDGPERMFGPGSTVNEMSRRFQDMQTRHVLEHPSDYRPVFERHQEQQMRDLMQQMMRMRNEYRGWDV